MLIKKQIKGKKRTVSAKKEYEIIERRKTVAQLYSNHFNMQQIADKLDVHRSTISRDIDAIEAEWQTEAKRDLDAHVARELAELDGMELETAVLFQIAKKKGSAGGGTAIQWYKSRLETKLVRMKLLGLEKVTAVTVKKLLAEDKTGDDKINDLKDAIVKSITQSRELDNGV